MALGSIRFYLLWHHYSRSVLLNKERTVTLLWPIL